MFQVRPHCSRSIFVLASKAIWRSPPKPRAAPAISASRVTGCVTPLMVSSPWILALSAPRVSMDVLRKVISGKVATSKKSGERRWSSRCCQLVSTLAVLMLTATADAAGSAASYSTVPSKSSKTPRTVLIIMCLAAKPTLLCELSNVQVLIVLCSLCVGDRLRGAVPCDCWYNQR